jgi:hypothetical protein
MEVDIKRCNNCILSENFPKIKFDENGICNFCNNQLLHSTDKEQLEHSRHEITKLFQDYRGKSEYDAVMCYSGGKDSTYTLRLAVEKYKLRVISFTLDNGFISPVAFKNIDNVTKSLGVDHITYKPSFNFIKDLFRVSSCESIYNPTTITRISANCNTCISMVNITALKMALEKDIPFILAGFTLGQIPANTIYFKNNYLFFKESRQPVIDKFKMHLGDEVSYYMEVSDSLIEKSSNYPYNINLLCLEDITEAGIVEEIVHMGWQKPADVDGCSTNCRINAFNNHIHFRKFGFSPYELELSYLIRKNLLSREEALEKIYNQPEEQIDLVYKELKIDRNFI